MSWYCVPSTALTFRRLLRSLVYPFRRIGGERRTDGDQPCRGHSSGPLRAGGNRQVDERLEELASGVNSLSKRSLVALFSTCSIALRPEFRKWAASRGASEELLDRALNVAEQFVVLGARPAQVALTQLL